MGGPMGAPMGGGGAGGGPGGGDFFLTSKKGVGVTCLRRIFRLDFCIFESFIKAIFEEMAKIAQALELSPLQITNQPTETSDDHATDIRSKPRCWERVQIILKGGSATFILSCCNFTVLRINW